MFQKIFILFKNLDVCGKNSTRIHEKQVQKCNVNFGDGIILLLVRKIGQSLVSILLYARYDIPAIHIKFDNSGSGSFGDYLSNKN